MEDCSRASSVLTSTKSKCVIVFTYRPHHLGTSPSTQWRTAKSTWKTWRGETYLDSSCIRTAILWFSSPKLRHYSERSNEREELNDMKVQKQMNNEISNADAYELRGNIYIVIYIYIYCYTRCIYIIYYTYILLRKYYAKKHKQGREPHKITNSKNMHGEE
jgi:hypothetical protein